MVNKVLVCWDGNLVKDEDHLKRVIQLLLSRNGTKELEIEFAFDSNSFDQKNKAEFDAIIVLCELTWDGHSIDEFFGIEFVKNKIALDFTIRTPVLFLSFEKREEILKKFPEKNIISAYALGYHFMTIPNESQSELDLFYDLSPIQELEKEDGYNFVSIDRVIKVIRHDVREANIEACKQMLLNMLPVIDNINFVQKIKDCVNVENVKRICSELEKHVIPANFVTNQKLKLDEKYNKVLLLEDESDVEELIKEAGRKGVEIVHKKKTSEAYEELESDEGNRYLVIIVDFRIWDNPQDSFEKRVMRQKQGYRFIQDVVKLGRRYTFISFSEMPTIFKNRLAYLSWVRVIPEEKTLVLSSHKQIESFVNKIIFWIEKTYCDISEKAFENKDVLSVYYQHKSSKESEDYVTSESKKWIDKFRESFEENGKIVPQKLFKCGNDFQHFLDKVKEQSSFMFKSEKNIVNIKDEKRRMQMFSNVLIVRRLSVYIYSKIKLNNLCEDIRKQGYLCAISDALKKNRLDKKVYEYRTNNNCKRTICNGTDCVKWFKELSKNSLSPVLEEKIKELEDIKEYSPCYLKIIKKIIDKQEINFEKYEKYTEVKIINRLLNKGYLAGEEIGRENAVMSQSLFLKVKNGISLTFEEEVFFKNIVKIE